MDTGSFSSLSWVIALQFALYAFGWGIFSLILRSERAAVAHWGVYTLLVGAGFLLASQRTETREWLHYAGSNIAYVLSWAVLARGMARFAKLPTRDGELALVTGVVCAVLAVLGGAEENASARVALTYGTGALMMARMLYTQNAASIAEFGWATTILTGLPALSLVIGFSLRTAHQIVDWAHPYEINVNAALNRPLLVIYLVGAAMFNFTFMALVTLRLVRQLSEQARQDPLTGLPNRRALEQDLQQAWRRFRTGAGDEVFAVVALDLDHFKRINDAHGHLAGDAVLEQLGRRLRAAVREYDVVARTGGEEFTVLMRGASPDSARAGAQRLLEAVREAPFELPGECLSLTMSAGLTMAHAGDTSVQQVIRRADSALYRAKDNGRDRLELALA